MSTWRVISARQTAGHHVSVRDRICRGNCISYSGYTCCGGSAQWGIIMTRKIISYNLFIYIGTRRSSTSSLKHNYQSYYSHLYYI